MRDRQTGRQIVSICFLSHFAFLIVNRLKYPHTHTLRQTPVAKFVKFHADHVKRQKKETEKTLERERV